MGRAGEQLRTPHLMQACERTTLRGDGRVLHEACHSMPVFRLQRASAAQPPLSLQVPYRLYFGRQVAMYNHMLVNNTCVRRWGLLSP